MSNPTHTNRLVNETSPYLLQHAHNPVDWYAWAPEALEKARTEDKPIFLSIGYSACHWCHVMERESFENEPTAKLMNDLFVNIKVDREERPDLDSIYMEAVQAMTGQGGWPMSVFLTPDGQPFYGGTYYPPEPRYGIPAFRQVLTSVASAYRTKRDQIFEQAQKLTDLLQRTGELAIAANELSTTLLDEAVKQLLQYFDSEEGGFGSQPKFPQPMTLDFAMTQYARTGDLDALYMAELTLERMAAGGIYDHLGGGFHRYSVDAVWLVPHFEKMLYDNAQLLRTYLHAWQITKQPAYRRVLDETIDYVLREMTAPEGGFYSTQDADSEGVEGKFFIWTPDEIERIVGVEAARIFNLYYGVSARGNFEGENILHVNSTAEAVAKQVGLRTEQVENSLADSRQKLFVAREKRIKPNRDEKILTEWNGLMIHALAECGTTLDRSDALQSAQNAANFVLTRMSQPDGKLYRSYKAAGSGTGELQNTPARLNAYLEDYAALTRALVALYEATFDLRWLGEATRLTRLMIEQFGDAQNGGFFQTGVDHEQLVVRRKDFVDNAIPSGNSLAAETLLRLAVLLDNDTYRKAATQILLLMKETMVRQPTGFGRLLGALNTLLSPSQEIALAGDPEAADTQKLLHVIQHSYLPNTVVALKRPEESTLLPLLEGRGLVNGQAAAYVCENYACKLPVTEAKALANLLQR
ncbi:MAG: thioredoxin domain-containing protein [Chloroflexi bacterium]|nr:thioredoxin domain-containing protein [Chloroflexota bacterium]